MTADVVSALRHALTRNDAAALVAWYGPDSTLELHLDGHRSVVTGPSGLALAWPRVSRGGGRASHVTVEQSPGGYDVDVQHSLADGSRPVRQVHRLHLVDGRVERHIVHPALPRATFTLPAGTLSTQLDSHLEALTHQGFSGASLLRARSATGEPLIIKHIRPANDWLARASRDPGREALLWLNGVHRKLPAGIESPVVDAARTEDGWLVVMRDVSDALDRVRLGAPLMTGERLLTTVTAMHRAFAGVRPDPALCTVEDRLRLFSPVRPLIERRNPDLLPKTVTTSWECFVDHADAAVAEAVLSMVMDPNGLLRALRAAAPATLLHGDYRPSNLGVDGDVVVALDWGLACHGPAELDFVWFLSNTAWADDDERAHFEAVWQRSTGNGHTTRIMDLAYMFHAVMGELAFVMAEAHLQPDGFVKPSGATVAWWLRRLEQALDRVGDLRG